MTYPTDEWPTIPVVWRNELPHCVGACKQGRIPCQHPLVCSCTTLSNAEFDDVAAEITTDRAPLYAAPREMPDITGRLTDDVDELNQSDTALLVVLLVICLAAWASVMTHLVMIWKGPM